MRRKPIVILIAAILVLTLSLTACGGAGNAPATGSVGGGNAAENNASAASDEEPYNIVFAYVGNEQADSDKVVAAINELTLRELNMTFEVRQLGFGDFEQKLNLMLSGGDALDIVPVYFVQAGSYINQGQILDMSELIESHGKGIIDEIGEDVAKAGSINGFLYGIPAQKESASKAGIVMRKDIVDELGIDANSIKTYHDLTKVFETVKQAYPSMDMIAGTTILEKVEVADPLFDYFGVLMNNGQDTNVVNYYESDWYRSRVEIVSDWYQKGYVKVDAATTTETVWAMMKADTLFSYISAIKPGFDAQEEAATGCEIATAFIGLDDGTEVNNLWSNAINFFNWGIASNSQNPEKAMEFLNFAYTNAEWNNLMNFGIQDEHYVFVDGSDTLIDFPSGVDSASTPYHLNIGWELPNQFLGYVWNGQPADIWQQYQAFDDSATKSKAFGFIYDSSSVSTELTALQNVRTQYRLALETGSAGANWEANLKEFNDKLYSSGLQTVMDLKQTQLDAWLAAK